MPSAPNNKLVELTRTLIQAAAENVRNSHALCKTARQLRSDNADFRDFLLEERMTALSLRERRLRIKSLHARYSGAHSDSRR